MLVEWEGGEGHWKSIWKTYMCGREGEGKAAPEGWVSGACACGLDKSKPRELHVNYLFPFLPTSLIYHFLFTHTRESDKLFPIPFSFSIFPFSYHHVPSREGGAFFPFILFFYFLRLISRNSTWLNTPPKSFGLKFYQILSPYSFPLIYLLTSCNTLKK